MILDFRRSVDVLILQLSMSLKFKFKLYSVK